MSKQFDLMVRRKEVIAQLVTLDYEDPDRIKLIDEAQDLLAQAKALGSLTEEERWALQASTPPASGSQP